MKGQFLEAYFRTVEDAQIQFADIKTANDFWNVSKTIVIYVLLILYKF